MLWLAFLVLAICSEGQAASADEAKTDRIKIEYVPPANPQHQAIYEMLSRM